MVLNQIDGRDVVERWSAARAMDHRYPRGVRVATRCALRGKCACACARGVPQAKFSRENVNDDICVLYTDTDVLYTDTEWEELLSVLTCVPRVDKELVLLDDVLLVDVWGREGNVSG